MPGTEEKAFAKDTGTKYSIDFARMVQRNVTSGFERPMVRIEQPDAAAPPPSTHDDATTLGVALDEVVIDSAAADASTSAELAADAPSVPADLIGEDLLILEVGQLLQTSAMRPDGWSRGQVVVDLVETRPASDIEGVSMLSGWFPLNCTALPDAEQLESLQKKMVSAIPEPIHSALP